MVTKKRCPRCDTVKLATEFYKSAKRHDGLSSYCRKCQLSDAKERHVPRPRWAAPDGKKWCPGCDTLKPLDTFGQNRSHPDGKQNYCKPCSVAAVTRSRHKHPTSHRRSSRAWNNANPHHRLALRLRRYRITPDDYYRMMDEQGGRCAICSTDKPGGKAAYFHVDHCHDEGHVRGLLCTNCNTGLGQFKHDEDILVRARRYLKKTKTPPE